MDLLRNQARQNKRDKGKTSSNEKNEKKSKKKKLNKHNPKKKNKSRNKKKAPKPVKPDKTEEEKEKEKEEKARKKALKAKREKIKEKHLANIPGDKIERGDVYQLNRLTKYCDVLDRFEPDEWLEVFSNKVFMAVLVLFIGTNFYSNIVAVCGVFVDIFIHAFLHYYGSEPHNIFDEGKWATLLKTLEIKDNENPPEKRIFNLAPTHTNEWVYNPQGRKPSDYMHVKEDSLADLTFRTFWDCDQITKWVKEKNFNDDWFNDSGIGKLTKFIYRFLKINKRYRGPFYDKARTAITNPSNMYKARKKKPVCRSSSISPWGSDAENDGDTDPDGTDDEDADPDGIDDEDTVPDGIDDEDADPDGIDDEDADPDGNDAEDTVPDGPDGKKPGNSMDLKQLGTLLLFDDVLHVMFVSIAIEMIQIQHIDPTMHQPPL